MLNPRIYLGLLSLFIGFNVGYGALGKETIREDEVKVDPRYEPIIKGALKFLAKIFAFPPFSWQFCIRGHNGWSTRL